MREVRPDTLFAANADTRILRVYAVAVSLVILMCLLNGTVIAAPPGFTWLIPVFFLKLTLGYMARARVASAVSLSA